RGGSQMFSSLVAVDVAIKIIHVLLMSGALYYLWHTGHKAGLRTPAGWRAIRIGLFLLLCGILIDVSNKFPPLNQYLFIEELTYKFYLVKWGSYLLGTLFLIAGLHKWVPALGQLQRTERELQLLRPQLEAEVATRTAALRQSEAELQTILDAVPAMIYYKDRENNLVRVNKTFAEIIGLPREEIEGHPNAEFYPQQAEAYWADDQEVVASGEPKFIALEPQGVGAAKRWLQTNKIPYLDRAGKIIGIIGFSRDITEQRESKRRLQRRIIQLALINRVSHAANAQLDLDELLETVYQEITRTFDYDAFFIALYDQERAELDYRINIDQGVHQEEECGRYPLSNNLTSHVVRTRAPLLISTQQEKKMLPVEPEAWGNGEKPPSWLGVPLLSGEQVLGVLCLQAYRPYLYSQDDQELLTTIANELAGAVKNARLYGELAASNHQLAATLDELQAAEAELVRQERLAAVGQLAGGIAHEYNNFMASIILYSQLLLKFSSLSAADQEKIAAIHSEARAAADLTQQILDFGREAMLQLEDVEACPFVHAIALEIERQLPHNIKLHATCQLPRPVTLHIDCQRLQKALLNLADNARLAMQDGGALSLSVTLAEPPPSSSMADAVTWIEISMVDTGVGMTAETLNHLYEPFFTTRRPLGSGLGLAQVYGTINQHGGQVKVQSIEGAGTTVTILLPAQVESGE
ncbi:MAG: PAS domain-containing protein, partial [Chloroflexota bacterium]|nr:PAS domain-containing protein [Chloroflexota bacterium]